MDGTFKMEPGAARKCAEVFQRFGDNLEPILTKAATLQKLSGFGTFQSSIDLENGFGGKGQALSNVLAGMQQAAYKMAASYLQAGGMINEAEAANKRAIALATEGSA
ncbi:hypothetical protein C5E45_18265 [Nocardia nova]|uniref:Uncharacterized protein n=1 Tax=Nocardia nova TaxID=37330 RepID=A0A2S6ANG7_9NOCA|nr:hypothetical protein C5E45_18265 [Nocardia nova]